jgi:prepilin-type processing-associated H-X9-DG protein
MEGIAMKVLWRRSGFVLWQFILLSCVTLILVAIMIPVFFATRQSHGKHSCMFNLKQLGLGFLQYASDYDERLPPIRGASSPAQLSRGEPYGWADALFPYVRITKIFQCPNEEDYRDATTDPMTSGYTDYWYNTNLSSLNSKAVKRPQSTLMAGDGNDGHDGADARYNRNSLPLHWLQSQKSPAYRHLDYGYYLFVDGHAKAYKATQIAKTLQRNQPTFAIR